MRSRQFPDVPKLEGADVEFLARRECGKYHAASQNNRNVHDEISGAFLHNLGPPEERIALVENCLALCEKAIRPAGLGAVLVGAPDERARPLTLSTQSRSVKDGSGDAAHR